uniref:Alpha-L-iduronidase n=1 Tax=Anopheles atroparvus TaxID=41427 RepID=A0AAG5DKV8_ANOAO
MAVIQLLIVLVSLVPTILLQASIASPETIAVTIEPSTSPQYCNRSAVCRDELETFPLTPFWSSTGLCPPEPRNESGLFLLSRDNLMNLEIVAALTNRAVRHVRIHWMLELLNVSLEDGHFEYNFTELDTFLDYLKHFGLHPAFELMGVPLGELGMATVLSERFWKDLMQQLAGHYLSRFGVEYIAEWRFETWNEPDLKNYNMLNFSVDGYLAYVNAIRLGLDAISAELTSKYADAKHRFDLYGPAGLFKAEEHHPFCWGIVKLCSADPTRCPIDTITFHRKGSGRWASEVVDGGRQLMAEISARFANIRWLKFANDEADPIASWSTGRPFQADVRYAAILFSIVAQHWDAMADTADPFGQQFRFLSHDNAFLSYHPYEFEQRTLLARFQMNETEPPHVQFVAKPVYSALGMLAMLGPRATRTRFREGNVSYIVSFDDRSPPSYFCLLASRSNDSHPVTVRRSQFNVTIPLHMFWNQSLGVDSSTSSAGARVSYLIEAIQDGLNDPFQVWQWQGRPAYPTTNQLAAMRAVQFPTVLNKGGIAETVQMGGNRNAVELSLSLRGPWIVSVRICSNAAKPGPVQRVRVRTVFNNDVLIFWAPPKLGNVRCIQKYEVWFKPSMPVVKGGECRWRPINTHQHTPFTFFQHVVNSGGCGTTARGGEADPGLNASDIDCSGVNGFYKVRAIDMFHQSATFSTVARYVTNNGAY